MKNSNRTILILNGPPGSGKDTLAQQLLLRHGFSWFTMKAKLNQLCAVAADIPIGEWLARANDRYLKDQSWDKLNGLSTRQFQIKVSEQWVKPTFGEGYFGAAAATSVAATTTTKAHVVFSDGGFAPEVRELQRVGTTVVVRLHRTGCTFAGDSRTYLYNVGHVEADINIECGEVDKAVKQLLEIVHGVNTRK